MSFQHSMTEKEARKVLAAHREVDEDTGEEYGYTIQKYCGESDHAHVFQCKVDGVDYDTLEPEMRDLPLMAVFPDGTVETLPT